MARLRRTEDTRDRVAIVTLGGDDGSPSLAEHVREGLGADRKFLGCQYFYDAEGSRLFEEICAQPEYYLTRVEESMIRASADAMVSCSNEPLAIIELGSGSSSKTRWILEAALRRQGGAHYVPIDISPTALAEAATRLGTEFPDLRVTAYCGPYQAALPELSRRLRGPKLLLFLGSSLGNYDHPAAANLLRQMGRAVGAGGRLLLGTDLRKERSVLEAAYDDAAGVTARFNLNLLARINRELGANFDLSRFRHRAVYDEQAGRIEMYLVSQGTQRVEIPGAGLTVTLADGEAIHTENSHKYDGLILARLAAESGFEEEASWTDDRGWFRVQRWRKS